MSNYFNKYGLLNAQPCNSNSEAEENSLLFTGLYLIFLKRSGYSYVKLLNKYIEFVELCRVGDGLFNQTPNPGPNDLHMSHDTLTGLVSVSIEFSLNYHTEIWKELKRQNLRYDNVSPNSPKRWLHPRDIIFYGICANSTICKLLSPILWIIHAIACIQKYKVRNGNKIWKTDGKILTFLRCQILNWKASIKIYGLFNKLFAGFKNWFHVFSVYYKKDHPVLKSLKLFDY